MTRAQLLAVALVTLATASAHADELADPYVYQRAGGGGEAWTVELDSAVGTRETVDGVEEALHVRRALLDGRLLLSASGGVLLDARSGDVSASGGALEGAWQLADVGAGVRLTLTGGWAHDYRGADLARARALLGRRFGRLDVTASSTFEVPFASDRDAVDVILGAGVAYRLAPSLHAGVEAVGEDLEGFFAAEEAEGGARLLFGPTLAWRVGAVDLRVNAGGVLQATGQETRSGWLGRLVLATSF